MGKEPPPAEIELARARYGLVRIFKHDFFAYTALYETLGGDEPRKIVLKIGRRASLCGLPLAWIGRLHSWHESAVFSEVDDLDIVPRFTGRWGRHGITHEFIEGHPLERGERVPDDFFPRLAAGLAEIHRRGLAYVDLEKCENVLVGSDSRPYLFDFQISWRCPFARLRGRWPVSWIARRFQAGDRYHLTKLRLRCRPDLLTPGELALARRKPFLVRLHGGLARPLTLLRRFVLKRVDPARKGGERGRVRFPAGESRTPPSTDTELDPRAP
ncbi:MAG: hypothetical protein HOP15_16120 [Planctomycetes bacterium]|nr:hypothetical protein [Planctomycetota bacterium]